MRPCFLLPALALGCDAPLEDSGSADCEAPTLRWVSGDSFALDRPGCASLAMQARVVGEGSMTVALALRDDQLVPTVTAGSEGASLRALVLEGDASLEGPEPLRWWRQGYQSWSWAGVVEPGAVSLDEDGLPSVGGAGVNTTFLQDRASTSWWAGLLGRPDGASLLLGAVGASRVPFYAAADDEGGVWAVWGGFDETYELGPGESLELDPLWIGVQDDAQELWRRYGRAAVAHTPARPLAEPSVGWSSWYTYYADVTEQDVRDNLAVVVALNQAGGHAPVDLLQVDDGWQVRWGEWTANDKFPAGMASLAADIRAAGLQPGLWMAPFYVHREASAYLEHDDWWVLDAEGQELRFDNDSTGDYAVLDVTHPDAAAWLEGVIADRVAEGWTYLKLDFLYAGAEPGQRHEPVSGLEAYARGLEILRRGAGEDRFILACGAPMLPSLGFAEGFRTGADIAFGWDPDPEPAYLRWQARATAGRAWMNGLWWWNDPDVLMLRAPYDDTRARGAVVAQLVSGGLWLAGDDLSSLDEAQLLLELHPEAASLRGLEVEPLAPLRFASGHDLGPVAERQVPDDRVPWMWRVGADGTALLNLGEDPVELPTPGGRELLTGEEAAAGTVRVLEPGEGEIWLPSAAPL
jgi:alpha-galactosidase